MACRLVGTKTLSEPMLEIVNLTLWNKIQWNINQNSYVFIQETASENLIWENCLGLNMSSNTHAW